MKHYLLILFISISIAGYAQNINGEKIIVGKESITIINFPDKVLNISFADDKAYEYYIPKRREEKSISIQFNKEHETAPNTSMIVNEGGRSHMFRIVFDPTYNINDDSRPPLWYDHSNLKELRAFVQKQKQMMAKGSDETEMDKEQESDRKKEIEAKKAEMVRAQQEKEKEAEERKRKVEEERRKEEERQKQEAEALAKAKREAEEKEKQFLLAKQKEEESRKAAEEEKQRKAAEELAKKEAERKSAQERLTQLEEERKRKEAEKAYSEVGLWQRYGKFGIDVYNYPPGQMAMVNTDFFIAADTLYHFRNADSLINTDIPDKLDIAADNLINKGVSITLENIVFKEIYTYYKLKVVNNTDEDFLLGKTYMYWYDANNQAKMLIKCSYLTYINFFPIISPGNTQYLVFATRSPNVVPDESLVLFIEDRRKEKGSATIVISGNVYTTEQAKVESKASGKDTDASLDVKEDVDKSPSSGTKKKKGRKHK